METPSRSGRGVQQTIPFHFQESNHARPNAKNYTDVSATE
jgi:hypothetical protein